MAHLKAMENQARLYKDPLKIGTYAIYGVLVWTVTLAILLFWNINQIHMNALDRAYTYTKVGFDKDLLYRRWASEHGGVYVKIDSTTPPSPYLTHIPERDIIIDSNLRLTLMNPAYMTRQVNELEKGSSETRSHITSLKPIRHENEADEWEKKALQAFEKGVKEFSEINAINGVKYFRFMKPFITEESCLKCHAHQGYKVNDIRGGISISYPMEQIYTLIQGDIGNQYSLYGIIWILGLLIIVIAFRQIKKSDTERIVAEESLLTMNSQLEDRVRNRTKKLQEEITERQRTEEIVQENQLQHEALFNFGADAIYLSDLDGNIIRTNNQAVKEMGYSKEEFHQLKVWDLDSIYPDIDAVKAFWDTLELNSPVTIESVHKRKDGTLFPIELRVNLTKIEGQKSILGFVRDITERKQVELELQKHRDHLEELIKERTQQLKEKNNALERINKLFVGREIRMKELKEEIEKLKNL